MEQPARITGNAQRSRGPIRVALRQRVGEGAECGSMVAWQKSLRVISVLQDGIRTNDHPIEHFFLIERAIGAVTSYLEVSENCARYHTIE
ncbi:hypothetical protein [Lentzea sp. CC55]|uniref:hypothetical protein n=1 Tax=Lentzea sp. CC55 TaxID=2884909 RepID=UPI001F37829F|nr:hypothetical protein [Lentzea sp. CC55]MCG8926254.1 hypothetical protein [Lentzea sp. CC55]